MLPKASRRPTLSTRLLKQLFVLATVALSFGADTSTLKPGDSTPVMLDGIRLQDHHGAPITAASFGNGPVLVQFLFTHCPAACPLQTKHLAAVRRALPPDVQQRVQFLSITVDPKRDTPTVLAEFARHMGADAAGWRFATGEPTAIAQLLQRLQVLDPSKPTPQPIDHRLNLYLYDSSGQPVIRYSGNPVDQPRLVDDLTQLSRLGR